MHLVFDIFQGIGIAAAIGIRPFLPGAIAALLAAIGLQIHFDHSGYGFLQNAGLILALLALAAALVVLERRLVARGAEPTRSLRNGVAGISAVLGALFFAGALARGHYAAWPGLIGGVACALIAAAATQPLLARVRSRLKGADQATLSVYPELAGTALAALSILAPPVGLLGLLGLLWLLVAGRRRADQKYAGLRILR